MRFALIFSVILLGLITHAEDFNAGLRSLRLGQNYSCALSSGGKIKCWGLNNQGTLGLGDRRNRGTLAGEMGRNLIPIDVGTNLPAVAMVTGRAHICALFNSGQVKCWGTGNTGALGLGSSASHGSNAGEMGSNLPFLDLGPDLKAISLAAGDSHTCALFDNGKMKCWGTNGNGQLGLEDRNARGTSKTQMGDKLPFLNLGSTEKIIQIAAGGNRTCAIFEDKKIKCWGLNTSGELGLGDNKERGSSAGEMGDKLPFLDLGISEKIISLGLGVNHSCVVVASGRVKCWGNNASGKLGLGDATNRGVAATQLGDKLPFVDLGTSEKAKRISAGTNHTCVVFESGKVKCWGLNSNGQLGLGDNKTRGVSPSELGSALPFLPFGGLEVQNIELGQAHTCALMRYTNAPICWGSNNSGQLGLGTQVDVGTRANEVSAESVFTDLGF